jgi:hypothetical protein
MPIADAIATMLFFSAVGCLPGVVSASDAAADGRSSA